jgi:hypothetical protein
MTSLYQNSELSLFSPVEVIEPLDGDGCNGRVDAGVANLLNRWWISALLDID